MHGKLPSEDGEQSLQLSIIVRFFLLLILQGPLQLLSILLRLGQVLTDHCGGGHTGGGGLTAFMVGQFGVLPQGKLHGRRRLEHHSIHPATIGLNGRKLTADGIGTARTGKNSGHASLSCLLKAAIHRVNSIHCPQVGGTGIRSFVSVIPLYTHCIPEHPQMTVGIHKSWLDMPALGIKYLALPLLGTLFHRPKSGNLLPPDLHISSGNCESLHGMNRSVDDQHCVSFPGKAGSDKTFR